MATNFKQPGEVLTLAAPYDRTSGQGALIGSIFGVAMVTVLSGVEAAFAVKGVWTLAKTSAQAWVAGDKIYWDNTNKRCDNIPSVGILIGYATEAAANPSSTGVVLLTGAAGGLDAGGLQALGVARAVFDPTGDATMRTVGAHTFGVTIPSGAIVVGGVVQVNTAFTSTGSTATVAISIQSANDIITAAAVSGAPWSTTGLKAITPKANTPESTGIALTAARSITATVAVEALLGGKATINLYYMTGS